MVRTRCNRRHRKWGKKLSPILQENVDELCNLGYSQHETVTVLKNTVSKLSLDRIIRKQNTTRIMKVQLGKKARDNTCARSNFDKIGFEKSKETRLQLSKGFKGSTNMDISERAISRQLKANGWNYIIGERSCDRMKAAFVFFLIDLRIVFADLEKRFDLAVCNLWLNLVVEGLWSELYWMRPVLGRSFESNRRWAPAFTYP